MRSKIHYDVPADISPELIKKTLVLVAVSSYRKMEKAEIEQYKSYVHQKIGVFGTNSLVCENKHGNALFIFDAHCPNIASFKENVRYYFRMFLATIMRYVGVNPVRVIVVV